MKTSQSPRAIYVTGVAANIILSYLDQQQLALPDIREKLTRFAVMPRMPITTWWTLLDDIYAAHPVSGLGLAIGRCTQVHHVGVLGYLLMYCETVGQALLRFHRFQPLLHNLTPSLIRQEGDNLILSWQPRASTLLSDEVVSSSLLTFVRSVMGHAEVKPIRVEWPHPAPLDLRPYELCFGCPVLFNAKTVAITIPASMLNMPVNSRDPHLVKLLEQQAEALMTTLPEQDVLLQQLQQHIVAVMQDEPPELTVVAARMGLSERSLYRLLQDRGLRYKVVLNTLRYELAKNYLNDAQLSLPEISLMLGYSEQSAFSRAFKEWSGETPMHYRRGEFKVRLV